MDESAGWELGRDFDLRLLFARGRVDELGVVSPPLPPLAGVELTDGGRDFGATGELLVAFAEVFVERNVCRPIC